MKKYKFLLLLALLIPGMALAAPVSWDKVGSILQPLFSSRADEVRLSHFFATSTNATSSVAHGFLSRFGSFWQGLEVSRLTATSTTATSTLRGNFEVWNDSQIGYLSLFGRNLSFGEFNTIGNGVFSAVLGHNNTLGNANYMFVAGKNNDLSNSGDAAVAIGFNNVSEGNFSVAMGGNNIIQKSSTGIDPNASIALGETNEITCQACVSIGGYNIVRDDSALETGLSTALGNFLVASGTSAISLGSGFDTGNKLINNIPYSIMLGAGSNLPTLTIRGVNTLNTVGKVGIGTTNPQTTLEVVGMASSSQKSVSQFIEFAETDAPSSPAINKGRLYSKDDGGGTTALFFMDSDGVEYGLTGGGGGCSTLNCLTDVLLSSPVASSTLLYNGSQWVNKLLGFGDIQHGTATTTQGGTGFSSYSVGDILYASASNLLSKLTIGSTGQYLRVAGGVPVWDEAVDLTSNQTIGGIKTFSLFPRVSGTPTLGSELVNKDYADNLAQGFTFKQAVRLATTTNITLSGEQNIDQVAAVSGNRILVMGQTAGEQNGCYVVAASAWSRCADYNESSEITQGTSFLVIEGVANSATQWALGTAGTIFVDTTPLVFFQISAPPVLTASNGVQRIGNDFRLNLGTNSGLSLFGTQQLWVDHDNQTLATSTGRLTIKDLGVTAAKIANGAIDLAGAKITGILGRANGGTGQSTSPDDNLLVGNGTGWDLKALPSCSASDSALAYNISSNSFSCNTITGGGGGGGSSMFIMATTTRKMVDESVTSSATLQNDDELKFTVGANEAWTFRFDVLALAPASPDIQFGVIGPAGAVCNYSLVHGSNKASVVGSSCTLPPPLGFNSGVNTIEEPYTITGSVITGGTSGTVTLQWSQRVSNATASVVKSGSTMFAVATTTPTLPATNPGGSDTQVQFNDGGVFGGNSNLTFNKTLGRLTATYASTTALSVSGTVGNVLDVGNGSLTYKPDATGGLTIAAAGSTISRLTIRDTNAGGTGTSTIFYDNSGQSVWEKQAGSGAVLMDFYPLASDGIGNATIRMFRLTNTAGNKEVQLLQGRSNTTVSSSLGVDGRNSYFQWTGGNFGIGTNNPVAKLNIIASTTNSLMAGFATSTTASIASTTMSTLDSLWRFNDSQNQSGALTSGWGIWGNVATSSTFVRSHSDGGSGVLWNYQFRYSEARSTINVEYDWSITKNDPLCDSSDQPLVKAVVTTSSTSGNNANGIFIINSTNNSTPTLNECRVLNLPGSGTQRCIFNVGRPGLSFTRGGLVHVNLYADSVSNDCVTTFTGFRAYFN